LSPAAFWNLLTSISLVTIAFFYALGLRRLWRTRAGKFTVRPWQAASFAIGCAAASGALLSRLDALSDILFSAHMAQHEILMLVSAPLMVFGRPFIVTLWSVSPAVRDRVAAAVRSRFIAALWERISGPFTVLVLHAVVLWAWHLPFFFEAALHNEPLHVVQHLCFFLTAALFWWALIHGRYGRAGYGIAVLYVFATAMQTEVLGALLAFGSHTWYPTHASRTAAAGMNAIADQRLAGIVMWIPFGVVFVLIALGLFAAWLGEAERRVAFTASEQLIREGRS
jgi:putative membrane protein